MTTIQITSMIAGRSLVRHAVPAPCRLVSVSATGGILEDHPALPCDLQALDVVRLIWAAPAGAAPAQVSVVLEFDDPDAQPVRSGYVDLPSTLPGRRKASKGTKGSKA